MAWYSGWPRSVVVVRHVKELRPMGCTTKVMREIILGTKGIRRCPIDWLWTWQPRWVPVSYRVFHCREDGGLHPVNHREPLLVEHVFRRWSPKQVLQHVVLLLQQRSHKSVCHVPRPLGEVLHGDGVDISSGRCRSWRCRSWRCMSGWPRVLLPIVGNSEGFHVVVVDGTFEISTGDSQVLRRRLDHLDHLGLWW